MRSLSTDSAEELGDILRNNTGWANGKNFPVDHLHATVAESRWGYENIHGIYVTNEQHAWMGLWMALCDRNVLRKRHISYVRPSSPDDALGGIELFTSLPPHANLCDTAYLYLVDPEELSDREVVDIQGVPKEAKVECLLEYGFEKRDVARRGRIQPALVDATGAQRVIMVDEWQVALTNSPDIVPGTELIIHRHVIAELAGRVAITDLEIGEDYIRSGST